MAFRMISWISGSGWSKYDNGGIAETTGSDEKGVIDWKAMMIMGIEKSVFKINTIDIYDRRSGSWSP